MGKEKKGKEGTQVFLFLSLSLPLIHSSGIFSSPIFLFISYFSLLLSAHESCVIVGGEWGESRKTHSLCCGRKGNGSVRGARRGEGGRGEMTEGEVGKKKTHI